MDRRLKQGQTLTLTPKRGIIFRALSVARRGYTAMLRQQKFLTVDALICLGLLFAAAVTEEQKRKKRERERERQNGAAVIA